MYASSVTGDDLARVVEWKVITKMNEKLLLMLAVEEVEYAIKQMHPTKASGPDGMAPIFFTEILKDNWKGCYKCGTPGT